MKQSELDRKLKEISKKIKKSKLLDKCVSVAVALGKGETQVHSSYQSENYKYTQGTFCIKYYRGYPMMGGGEISVCLNNKSFFSASELVKKRDYPVVAYDHSFWEITKYIRGDWEEKLESLYKKRRELGKECSFINKPSKDKQVSKGTLMTLRNRFGDLF